MKKSLQKRVESEISLNFFLREAIISEVVNFRAVARRLKKKFPDATVEAIAVAIKRCLEKEKNKELTDSSLLKLLRQAKVRAVSDVADFTLEPGEKTISKVSFLMRKIKPSKSEIFHFVCGHKSATLIVDMENFSVVNKHLSRQIISSRKNVAEVSLTTPSDVEKLPGWVALISRLVSRSGINMIETLSCYTETILIVEEKDVGRVLEILSGESSSL